MKSIKPGRGPSMMGGVGAVFAAIFGVIWMAAAAGMGAPPIFPLFGLVFIGMAVAGAVYNFKNATGKNRYSAFDIVDGHEEPDPLNRRFGGDDRPESPEASPENAFAFCPYCGAKAKEDFEFCNKCGKRLP